jgi:uncharacterized membrane protein (UPF0136 family)
MGGSAHASFGIGAIVIAGGGFAYYKKKSVASLIGGLVLGGSFLLAGSIISGGKDLEGHVLATTASVLLAGTGASRYFASKKMMPAAPMVALGLISLAYNGKKALEWS